VDPRLIEFTQHQWRHSFNGGLAAVGCRVVNDPTTEQRASFKPYQLKMAAASGLRVPETLITNSPEEAEAFRTRLAGAGRRTVYKPLTGLRYHLGETRELTESTDTGDSLRLAPVIFQQFVEKGRDLRVLVAGNHIAAAAVTTAHDELIDWRLDPLSGFETFTLGDDLTQAVQTVVRSLGLHTASLDLRMDRNGDIYFFEANPGGQFLMLDNGTHFVTAELFARSLIDLAEASTP
jgi:glutathione synthase/RimK-type ligase-like ATP-grasp enzyme